MESNRISLYRHWYARLIRLYPAPYYDRFGEGMKQTFGDLCREYRGANEWLLGLVLWVFVETSVGIIKEHLLFNRMYRTIIRLAIIVGLILLIPLIAMQFTNEVQWTISDFAFMGALLFAAGLGYELVAKKTGTFAYRAATALAVLASFLLVWINAAVGFIGEENPANFLYLGVILVGITGAVIARLESEGMARASLATAAAQAIVPVFALIFWREDFSPGVLGVFTLNSIFVILFLISAALYRRAARKNNVVTAAH